MSIIDPRSSLLSHLPIGFIEDTVTMLFDDYALAHHSTHAQFPPEVAHNKVGYERWAMISRDWPLIAARYGLVPSFELNSNEGWHYTVVGNEHIVMTHSRVSHPGKIVQKAIFRQQLAQDSQQLDLFPEATNVVSIAAEKRFYAILLHGPDPQNRSQPAFAHLAVPSADCSCYIAKIDLFTLCAEHTTKRAKADMEVIIPTIGPRLKKKESKEENSR